MNKLIFNSIKHANIIIVVILLITAGMAFLASGIVFDPDYYSIFPDKNERRELLFEKTGIIGELDMYLMLSVKSDDALSVEKLQVFDDVLRELEAHQAISDCISPFDFITFVNKAGRLSVEKVSSHSPRNKEELAVFKERLLGEPLAQDFVVSDDGKTLTALLINTPIEDSAGFMLDFKKIIEPLQEEFEVLYTGDLPFSELTVEYLQRDLLVLVVLAILIILVVLYFSFHAFRAVFLPLVTVGIGALWSIGFSAVIGYNLTVVSVVLPIIILAIGSSYTVHILSEYFRSYNAGDGEAGIAEAVSHVVLTVILAGVTTIIGFSSLLFTSIRPLKEFGLSVSFGILTCVILSIFFLPALLSKLSPPKTIHKEKIKKDLITKAVVKLGEFVNRRYIIICIAFLITVAGAFLLYSEISRKVDYVDYFPKDNKLIKDTYQMLADSGGSQSMNITLVAPEGEDDYFLQDNVVENVLSLQEDILDNVNVIGLTSYFTIVKQINGVMTGKQEFPKEKGLILLLSRYFKLLGDSGTDLTYGSQADFINDDYSQLTFFIKVYDGSTGKMIATEDTKALSDAMNEMVSNYLEGVDVHIWGNTIINYDAAMQIQRDQLFSALLSMILIFAVSSIFFRSLRLGWFSLIPLISAIAFNYIVMAVFKIPLDVTTVLVSNVAIGVGVDDAIHFILQYQKQSAIARQDCRVAVSRTFFITGRPIVLTTVSIVAGFLVLGFASFKPIVFFGILVSISLLAAMLSTLIFLPAFIIVIDKLHHRIKKDNK